MNFLFSSDWCGGLRSDWGWGGGAIAPSCPYVAPPLNSSWIEHNQSAIYKACED